MSLNEKRELIIGSLFQLPTSSTHLSSAAMRGSSGFPGGLRPGPRPANSMEQDSFDSTIEDDLTMDEINAKGPTRIILPS